MIVIVHNKARELVQISRNSTEIGVSGDLCDTFWKLAGEFPEELIVWVEKELYPQLDEERLAEIFHNDLIMSSYAIKTKFLSGKIGYVDQLPFINVEPGVKYPTWRMSSDVGGIKGKTLLKFKFLLGKIRDFNYLLNSVAKLGQQNGLFCYSDPQLINTVREEKLTPLARNNKLFTFVFQHYNSIWIFVLFFSLLKYEKKFPISALFQSLLKPKLFKKDIDLSALEVISESSWNNERESTVDVVIPTIGRPEYVRQVVLDLSRQNLPPKRLIIVEQQPELKKDSELLEVVNKKWPFEVIHIFTHKTGACMARNLALKKVQSEWIFFADDDIRLEKEVLRKTLSEADRLKIDCINLNCKQPGEKTIFHKVKQWGSFGSGTSVVHRSFAKKVRFSEIFEHGYGEDVDYGMKLRKLGCDIIYHPGLEIQHLKAPVGGFRKKPVLPWEREKPKPKPSPTVMVFAKRYYTLRQMKGFKISLFLKYFRNQKEYSPFAYFRTMEMNWQKSETWATRMITDTTASRIQGKY